MATEEDAVGTGAIGTMVAVLALAVVVIGLAVTALVRNEQSALNATREASANLRPIRELRAAQLAEINATPAFVDKAHGVINVPIDRAMELIVGEARSRQETGQGAAREPREATQPAASAATTPSAAADSSAAEPKADQKPDQKAELSKPLEPTPAASAVKPASGATEVPAPPAVQGHAP